jgi:hypothetical protein
MPAPPSDELLGNAEVSTVESMNIHEDDLRPPVTNTDEHGNITTGHMEDLTFSDNPVNSDYNAEVVESSTSVHTTRIAD